MKKQLFLLMCLVLIGFTRIGWGQTNPGLETGDLSGWTKVNGLAGGTESALTSNIRSGSYAMSITTTSLSTPTRMENSLSRTTNTSSYFHTIAWVRGSSIEAEAAISIKFGTSSYSSGAYVAPSTSYFRISRSRQNTGVPSEGFVGLSTRSSDGTTSATIVWDDIVTYISTSSTTDLTAPASPTSLQTNSNPAGTTTTVTWTDGIDAATGSQQALILRADGLSQTPPTLNDQAQYTIGNTVGSWSVIGIVNVGNQTFDDNTTIANTDYTYAVYMADLAFNYSVGTSSSIPTLPVELTSFSVSANGNAVTLAWQTETEVDNYGFEVERTSPRPTPLQGEGGEGGRGWSKVGFVNGAGNSNSPKEYSYTDNSTTSGKYLYRLKQIDNDGQYTYSKEVEVDLGTPTAFALEQNYPNPFNPVTAITYAIPSFGVGGAPFVVLKVYNMLGTEVATLVNQKKEPGIYKVDFSAAGLASGVYLYSLQAGGFVQVKKLVVLK